jgi:FkbM family methyltransferase
MYYESDFISLANNEVFVDGGAFDGETAKDFLKRLEQQGLSGGSVYAFEPCIENFDNGLNRLIADHNITLVQKGLWSSETNLFLSPCYSASSFVNHSKARVEYLVPVTSLDIYFKYKTATECPTFIKMDIEGSEKEALLGSVEIIKQHKPKLAICAYHKPEDIYELPQTILGIRDDYRFGLRQHKDGYNDTILYAC